MATKKKKVVSKKTSEVPDRQKLDILRALTALLDVVARAESTARREGWIEEADVLDTWYRSLDEQIDRLRAEVLRAWTGDAKKVVKDIKARTAEIETATADLKQSLKTAEAAIKIAGHLDDAIKMAAKLLS